MADRFGLRRRRPRRPLDTAAAGALRMRARARGLAARAPRPELMLLLGLAAVLNLWALSRNGWANEYYSAAVRSMSSSWHDFLFASLDRSGVMTVDKPPLALWVQALSVRVFGYHSLSVLVPQALMGVASVALALRPHAPRVRTRGRLRGGARAGAHADHGGDLAPQQPGCAAGAVLRGRAVVHGPRIRFESDPPRHALAGPGRACASGWASRRRWASR